MLSKLLSLLTGKSHEVDHHMVAYSPHDGRKHTFHYEGHMNGFAEDVHLWTSDDGHTFTAQSIIEEQVKHR